MSLDLSLARLGAAFASLLWLFTGCAGSASQPPARPASPAAHTAHEPARGALPIDENARAAFGLEVAPGFVLDRFADETLADDIYSMAFTSEGRLAVSSAGWIKLLHDDDRDGRADRASTLLETESGSHGLHFDGDVLHSFQDGALVRFTGVGEAQRPEGTRLLEAEFGEHGGHQMRRGPDGGLYFLASNMSEIDKRNRLRAGSPIGTPSAGVFMRVHADGHGHEVLSDGLRNPYRFDFTPSGDVVTYDSDGERDVFLPWYIPTRVHALALGGHHGWQLPGWRRTFARSRAYPDVVPYLLGMGLGSPTAVVVYRHQALPARYRDGVFLADWTYGRIHFVPLTREGAGLQAGAPEPIVSVIGSEGFAPSDAAVGPDGAIYVAKGGRGTRGGVFRLSWRGPVEAAAPTGNDLSRVLMAPQPLEAWSRARWLPLARTLGRAPFEAAIADARLAVAARVRAIEVLTEVHGGLSPAAARPALQSEAPVRARLAWALGRAPQGNADALLLLLARDADAEVRRVALEALDALVAPALSTSLASVLAPALADDDGRVRLAATWLASRLPAGGFAELEKLVPATAPFRARAGLWLARVWRAPQGRSHGLLREPRAARTLLAELAEVLARPTLHADEVHAALRLLALALGDWNLESPGAEVFAAYRARGRAPAAVQTALAARLMARFPTGDPELDDELLRALSLLDPPGVPSAFSDRVAVELARIDDPARATGWLIAWSNLAGVRSPAATRATAQALLSLRDRVGPDAVRRLQNWEARIGELALALQSADRQLAPTLAAHETLLSGWPLSLARHLPLRERRVVAERLLARAGAGLTFSSDTVALLATLEPGRVRPLLRTQLADPGSRDAILLVLAERPEPADRAHFVAGLESYAAPVRLACLQALARVGVDPTPEGALALMRELDSLLTQPTQRSARALLLSVLGKLAGQRFRIDEGKTPAGLARAYQPVKDWFAAAYPEQSALLADAADAGGAEWLARLAEVPWDEGDVARGETVVKARACFSCHGGERAFGPSLSGAARRLSREDLFTAIAVPAADVAPAYQPLLVETRDGAVHTGLVIYEGPDNLLLRTGPETTLRFASGQLRSRRAGEGSLMPPGLLAGLNARDIADMYAYLRALE